MGMDHEDLIDRDRYDVILVGTGVCESVLAGALARTGRSVLHLDPFPFYGGASASLTLSQFKAVLLRLSVDGESERSQDSADLEADITKDVDSVEKAARIASGVEIVRDSNGRFRIHDGLCRGLERPACALPLALTPKLFAEVSFDEKMAALEPKVIQAPVPEAPVQHAADQEPKTQSNEEAVAYGAPSVEGWDEILKQSRQYSIDLTPKLTLSSGDLVQALLRSGVHRYLEFIPMGATFIHLPTKGQCADEEALHRVPMSKAEIFQSKMISPVEKRLLMKFMQASVIFVL